MRTMRERHRQTGDIMKTEYGGFQEAAKTLSELSGKTYSRQSVEQFHKNRDVNGFPDRHEISINGHDRTVFDLQEVKDFYSIIEAAELFTELSGKLWRPSDVYKLYDILPKYVVRDGRLTWNRNELIGCYERNIHGTR